MNATKHGWPSIKHLVSLLPFPSSFSLLPVLMGPFGDAFGKGYGFGGSLVAAWGRGTFSRTRCVIRSLPCGRILWEGVSTVQCVAWVLVKGRVSKRRWPIPGVVFGFTEVACSEAECRVLWV